VIRPGRPGDLDEIRALSEAYRAELAAAGKSYPEPPGGAVAWTSWLRRRLSAGDVRVGVEERRITSYIVWELRRGDAGGRVLAITDLYVLPSERGNRRGGGLLARALDRARAGSLASVEADLGLDDDAARKLLTSFGFAPGAHGTMARRLADT
jgi:GNAT superfamily N-acetyltransferase